MGKNNTHSLARSERNGLNAWTGHMKWMNALAIHKKQQKKKQTKQKMYFAPSDDDNEFIPSFTNPNTQKYYYVIAFVGENYVITTKRKSRK